MSQQPLDLDTEEKLLCLVEAFKHDRNVIFEILKKNNYSLDAAALELSELPSPPTSPPTRVLESQQQFIPPPNYYAQPPPGVQPQPVQPSTQPPKSNDKKTLMKDIASLLGNTELDQSTIYAVYQQSNNSIDETVKLIKDMTVDSNPTEQMRKEYEAQLQFERQLIEEQKRKETEALIRQQQQQQILLQERQMQEEKRLYEQMKVQQMIAMEKAKAEAEHRAKVEAEQKAKTEAEQKAKAEAERKARVQAEKMAADQDRLERERMEQFRLQQQKVQIEEMRKKQKEEQARLEEEKKARLLSLEVAKIQFEETRKLEQARQEKENLEKQIQIMQDMITQKEMNHLQVIQQQQQQIVDFEQKTKEIEILRQKLEKEQEGQMREKLNRENEELLKKQILELEAQKEAQDKQLLELDAIQKGKDKLETMLKDTQQQLLSHHVHVYSTLSPTNPEEIIVNWSLGSKFEPNTAYWIGIYPTHQPKHERYLAFKSISSASGEISFPGIIPGHYIARLFKDKYTFIQDSKESVKIGIDVNLAVHIIGDEINVTFNVSGGGDNYPIYRDWIGIYSQNQRNKKYITTLYANTNGSVTFKSPRAPGHYEIRYFAHPTKYNEQAKHSFELVDNDRIEISTPVASPGEAFRVEYTINTSPPSTSDWVGIFSVDETNNKNYILSKYTNGTGTGEINFTAPTQQGEYEARFFSYSKGKYIVHKVSNKITVTPF
ncbi:hypothetical protein CYY_000614 [Polysphondylium violaceum]|uniref:SKICH domain-containing protein n=1 Tax=Polysphondylium violaceum TaxID=133409 RepID=A0A8J4PZG1_9MYCE|nr:hypothetical protein CYY_000614 [Polysphondylium violaceum]